MTKENQTVSVVMATYNGEKYIKEQLDSILAQTYPIYELIIQDDCSTDSTPAICREYEREYPFVHFYENEHNLGFNLNFQTAAMRATGDFVALSDQDDVWFKDKIEKQVAAIGDHDICASYLLRGESMDKSQTVIYSDIPIAHLFRTPLGHSMLLRREFVQEEDNWKSGSQFYDWSLVLNADLHKGVVMVRQPLNLHRWQPESFSSSCQLEGMTVHNPEKTSKWTPYLQGFQRFHMIKRKERFGKFYGWICRNTENDACLHEMHAVSRQMLRHGVTSTLKLCLMCYKHRRDFLLPDKSGGIGGSLRGFFYPAIYFYWTDFFD